VARISPVRFTSEMPSERSPTAYSSWTWTSISSSSSTSIWSTLTSTPLPASFGRPLMRSTCPTSSSSVAAAACSSHSEMRTLPVSSATSTFTTRPSGFSSSSRSKVRTSPTLVTFARELHLVHLHLDVGDAVDLAVVEFVGDEHGGRLLVGQPAHLLDLRLDGLPELLQADVGVEVLVDVLSVAHNRSSPQGDAHKRCPGDNVDSVRDFPSHGRVCRPPI